MSATASYRTRTARIPCWSSTGNAAPWPHTSPASHSSPHSSASRIVMTAESHPISHTSSRNQLTHAPQRFAPTSSQRSNRHRRRARQLRT
jgi:hypothetical protein